jgi:alpha-ketoglutarate-dependent taurine dioxygenase
MNVIKKIENCQYKDIIDNIDYYVDMFLSKGFLGFNKINISFSEQEKLMNVFAEKLKWKHISSINMENHTFTIDLYEEKKTKDQILIPWHLEHVKSTNPQVAASWNMRELTCPIGHGMTGFINSRDVWKKMPKEWLQFLSGAVVKDSNGNFPARDAIKPHPNTHEPMLRIGPNISEDLITIHDKEPSKEDVELFNIILKWIFDTVNNDEQIQKWWIWDLYDIIIVDLFSMYHAVKGGFEYDQRIFSRFWAYESNPENHLYILVED